jgi:hypothetical protein
LIESFATGKSKIRIDIKFLRIKNDYNLFLEHIQIRNLCKDFVDDVCLYFSCHFLITTVSTDEINKAHATATATTVTKTPLLIPFLGENSQHELNYRVKVAISTCLYIQHQQYPSH